MVAIPSAGFEGWQICCAFVERPGAGVSTEGLRKDLGGLLPAYMLPTRWQRCDELPKNASGKIDRPKLKQGFLAAHAQAVQVRA